MATNQQRALKLVLTSTRSQAHAPRIFHRSKRRVSEFHTTSRRPFVDECLIMTHSLYSGIHNITGLSWGLSIPLTALVVRGFLFPLDWYDRKVTFDRMILVDKLEHERGKITKKVLEAQTEWAARERGRIGNAIGLYQRELKKISWSGHTIQRYMPRCIAFAVTLDTLRRMCGNEEWFTLLSKSLTADRSASLSSMAGDVIAVEDSLTSEGIFWFPDLLLPDPWLVLPFLLSVAMMGSLRRGSFLTYRHAEGKVLFDVSDWLSRRRAWAFALAVGLMTLAFPSGLLLYCISFTICGWSAKHLGIRLLPEPKLMAPLVYKIRNRKQQYRGPTMKNVRSQKQQHRGPPTGESQKKKPKQK